MIRNIDIDSNSHMQAQQCMMVAELSTRVLVGSDLGLTVPWRAGDDECVLRCFEDWTCGLLRLQSKAGLEPLEHLVEHFQVWTVEVLGGASIIPPDLRPLCGVMQAAPNPVDD